MTLFSLCFTQLIIIIIIIIINLIHIHNKNISATSLQTCWSGIVRLEVWH